MKKLYTCLFCLLLSAIGVLAQSGKVFDNLSLKSKILNMDRKYAVYLPADYETSNRSYPVLYLLHGSGDDQTGWVQFGEVNQIADKAIKEGKSTAMIIVMPDANTGVRGYFNSIKGDFQYEDFFFRELIPFIEKTYRVRSEKRYRAIAGLSMGGGGTIVYALHHPELFVAACPLSAGNGLQEVDSTSKMLKRMNPTLADDIIAAYAKNNNGIELVKSLPDSLAKAVRWYIDCGDDDIRSEANARLHIAMNKKAIPHEFRIRDGAHTWTYWREALPEVLRFVSQSFHQY
jgi:enterochelin esterase-like enzyme